MFLVTGATGTVGRPLVDLLVGEGGQVRAVTRDPRAASLPAGVEVVEGDPSRPDTIASCLRGVTALFLNPAAVGDAAGDLLTLAREQPLVESMLSMWARSVGHPATVAAKVEKTLGRPARTFAEWATDHTAAFTD